MKKTLMIAIAALCAVGFALAAENAAKPTPLTDTQRLDVARSDAKLAKAVAAENAAQAEALNALRQAEAKLRAATEARQKAEAERSVILDRMRQAAGAEASCGLTDAQEWTCAAPAKAEAERERKEQAKAAQ